jgi:opacity protein-like surface antigen
MVALVFLIVALVHPALAQQPAPGQLPAQPPEPGPSPIPGQPPGPGQPPPTGSAPAPVPGPPLPIPVIPEVQPIGPPPTVPSAPQRVLPPTAGLPVSARFQFEPSVTLREEYTDNFNLTERNKQSNFRSIVSPELRLGINSPLTKGLVAYTFSPSYDTSTEDVLLFHSLLGQIVWQANPRWQLTLADTFTKSDQPGEADRLGLRQERRTFTTNTFAVASDYLIGTVATRQSYRLLTFSDDGGSETTTHGVAASASIPLYQVNMLTVGYDYLNTDSSGGSSTGSQIITTGEDSSVQGHQVTISASRRISPLTVVGLKGSYALRNVTTETDDSDFQIWNTSVFATYTLPGRLILDASIGVSGLTSGSETLGPNLSTASSLSYQFARASVALIVDRGFSETFAETQNLGVVETEGVTGTFTYLFTPSVTGTASGFYRRNKFTGLGTSAATQLNPDEDTKSWGGSAGVSWSVLRNLLLNLTYNYVEQAGSDTDVSTGLTNSRSYTENRVQASIRINF